LAYRAFGERGLRHIADILPGMPDPRSVLDCGHGTGIRGFRRLRPNRLALRGNQAVRYPNAEQRHLAANLNQPA
jgi:hypothetical protein